MIEGETMRPFVSGTFGLTRMDPKGSDLNTENHFSLALGTGVKFYLSRNFGLRFDMRAIYTAVSSDTAIFCAGGCAVQVSSTGFMQTELGAALMLRF
jgi:outer membrane protein W